MNDFERTAVKAETSVRANREREENKLCKIEIFNSINHLETSLGKALENTDVETLGESKQHIDNVYYHIGKIKGHL